MPQHPDFEKLGNESFLPVRVLTDPSGAEVFVKGYGEPQADWVPLGRSPIETRGTIGAFRWRVIKPGFETFEGSGQAQNMLGEVRFALAPQGSTPEGMVRVPGGAVSGIGQLPAFFIDKYEVTNKAFKRFVDAGGYRDGAILAVIDDEPRPHCLVGGVSCGVPRRDRPPRALDLGARHVPGGPG